MVGNGEGIDMDKDTAINLVLHDVVIPALVHMRFDSAVIALDLMAAMVVLTGHAWSIAGIRERDPQGRESQHWIIIPNPMGD
jgi:hypothetical protein